MYYGEDEKVLFHQKLQSFEFSSIINAPLVSYLDERNGFIYPTIRFED